MRELMQIISVLSGLYERDMNEFMTIRGNYNKKCRAFRMLGYFCYEAYLNGEIKLPIRTIEKFIHQEEIALIQQHKYVFVRMRINALTGREVKIINNILNEWKSAPQFK